MPCFTTALSFYDGYRHEKLPANLLQVRQQLMLQSRAHWAYGRVWQYIRLKRLRVAVVCVCVGIWGALRLQQCAGWVLTTLLICLWTRFLKLPQHINIKLKQFVQSFITQKCQISLVLNVKICCFSLIYNHCTFNNRWLNKTDSEVRFESV